MKIDAVLARHPWPWVTWSPDEGSWWEVQDANGEVVFDDGSSMGEYGHICTKMIRDAILELVAVHVASKAKEPSHGS